MHARWSWRNQGNVVLLLAPRGAPPRQTSQYSGDWIPNVQALLIGRNLPAMRAHDILAGVRILAARDDVDPAQIRAEASGVAGVWLLMAAALDPSIAAVSVSNTPYSLQAPFESPLTRNLHAAVIPGFALYWDLADLVSPNRVTWCPSAVLPTSCSVSRLSSPVTFIKV